MIQRPSSKTAFRVPSAINPCTYSGDFLRAWAAALGESIVTGVSGARLRVLFCVAVIDSNIVH